MFRDARYIRSEEELKVPMHLNFGKFVFDKIKTFKDDVALINGKTGEKMTYRELTKYAVNVASGLLKLGVGIGDVVALCSENRNEYIAIILGIILTGATCSPMSIAVGRAEFLHKLQLTKPKYIITSKQFWEVYSDIIKDFDHTLSVLMIEHDNVEIVIPLKTFTSNEVDFNHFEPAKVTGQTDRAIIFFTSGSTDKPKGIFVTHLTFIVNCSLYRSYEDPKNKTMICTGECSYTYDNYATFAFLLAGKTTVHYYDITTVFFKSVEHYKVDTAIITPGLINEMTEKEEAAKFNLDSIKYVVSSTSPLDIDLKDRYLKKYPNVKTFVQSYGISETSVITSECFGIPGLKKNTIGKIAPRITLKVVDVKTREPLGPNQLGELCVDAHNVFNGYVGSDPSTYLDEEGFFLTGDLVYYDEDGYFYIIDRIKEIIKYYGITVSPVQIEKLLLRYPGVQDAGVVGKLSPAVGELATAFIVKKTGVNITEKELIDYISHEGSDEIQLRGGVKFVQEIPRNSMGKIKRRYLRSILNG